MYWPTSSGSPLLLSAYGTTLISDEDKIIERWAEHFSTVLTRPINDGAIARLLQSNCNQFITGHSAFSCRDSQGICMFSRRKATGHNASPAQIFKDGDDSLGFTLHLLFLLMWKQEKISQEYKDAIIISTFTRRKETDKIAIITKTFLIFHRWLDTQ